MKTTSKDAIFSSVFQVFRAVASAFVMHLSSRFTPPQVALKLEHYCLSGNTTQQCMCDVRREKTLFCSR